MTIRLNKVTRDLNVGITTAVEFLQKKGFTVEANPNTKITDEQFELLKKEFSTDKNLRLESERFIQERQNKERNKASVSIEGFEKQPEKPKSSRLCSSQLPQAVVTITGMVCELPTFDERNSFSTSYPFVSGIRRSVISKS
mgnify:CR=1 FL=1